jgi:hypothetical protein
MVHFVPDRAFRTLAEDHLTYRSHQTPDFLLRPKLIQLIAIQITKIGATQKLSRPLIATTATSDHHNSQKNRYEVTVCLPRFIHSTCRGNATSLITVHRITEIFLSTPKRHTGLISIPDEGCRV